MAEGTRASCSPGLSIADTLLALGQSCLDRGEGDRAVTWFRSAARGGDARAITMLGRCLEHGWGIQADPCQAAAHYRKAADLGDGWAMFNLADLHCHGIGVPADDEAAYRLYAASASRGNAKALNMLGLFHESGRAVPADHGAARALFRAAAEGGDCWGRFNHARMLLRDGSAEEALRWFRLALDSGFPDFYRSMAAALAPHPDPRIRALATQAGAKASACAGPAHRNEVRP